VWTTTGIWIYTSPMEFNIPFVVWSECTMWICTCNIKHQASMLLLTPLGCHMDKGRPRTKQSRLQPDAWYYMVFWFGLNSHLKRPYM
jgi:hypothetical protein